MNTERNERLVELAEALELPLDGSFALRSKGMEWAVKRQGLVIRLTKERKATRIEKAKGGGGVAQSST